MTPITEVILKALSRENAGISQDIEDCMPCLRHWKGLAKFQVSVKLVCRPDERRASLPNFFMGLTADDSTAAAEIKARCAIAESKQGGCGSRVTSLHQNAPNGSFGRRRGDTDLSSSSGKSLVPQT